MSTIKHGILESNQFLILGPTPDREYNCSASFMINFYDIAYGFGVAVASPYWAVKSSARRKVLIAFSQRMGNVARRDSDDSAILIHAVSLGEMNATRSMI